MKTKYTRVEKTEHAFSKKTKVFMKENGHGEKEKWYPINFHWIPVVRLNKDLNKL